MPKIKYRTYKINQPKPKQINKLIMKMDGIKVDINCHKKRYNETLN